MNNGNGYITLSRKMFESDRWLGEKFTKGQAWADMIFLANYTSSSFETRGIKVDVKRGQIARKIGFFNDRWKWSTNKVVGFFTVLGADGEISRTKNNIISLITLLKYDQYQFNGKTKGETESGTESETESGTESETKGVHKKESKEKKKNSSPPERVPGTGDPILVPDFVLDQDGHWVPDTLGGETVAVSNPSDPIGQIMAPFYQLNKTFKFGNKFYRKAIEELLACYPFEEVLYYSRAAVAAQQMDEWATKIKNPVQLRDKYHELVMYLSGKKNSYQKNDRAGVRI